MADAVGPVGEDMGEEPPHELRCAEGHRSVAVRTGLAVILDLGRDALAVECGDAAVRDGNAMRVAGEIGQHLFGPCERRLGVDHPVALALPSDESGERALLGEAVIAPEEPKLASGVQRFEPLAHQPPEQAR